MAGEAVGRLRDIGLLEDALGKQLARLRAERNRIMAEAASDGRCQLTDHAVIRYMERVEKMDLHPLKMRFQTFISESEPTGYKKVKRHPVTGFYTLFNQIGTAVTVVPEILNWPESPGDVEEGSNG